MGRVMQLIIFHRILIGAAIAFGAWFAVWEGLKYRQTGALKDLLIGGAAAVISALLGYYLKHLKRFLSR
jgi:hypothetical protein